MKLAILFGVLFIANVQTKPDYYWRDYDGMISDDALAVTDLDKRCRSYIGQVYIHGIGQLVGQLRGGVNRITVTGEIAGAPVYNRTNNIKILCTRHPENFQWIASNNTTLINRKNVNLVIGGTATVNERKIFIGRIQLNGYKIGRVTFPNMTINFPCFGKEQTAEKFEILVYNGPRLSVSKRPLIRRLKPKKRIPKM